jgi:serine/threonine protein kinase
VGTIPRRFPEVPGYELLEYLGGGGFADVYRARDPRLRREVAVKVLRPRGEASERDAERFRREAEVMARVRHGSIVKILDADLEAHPAYLVSPYYAGGDLETRLGLGPGAPEKVTRVGEALAEGLAAVHDAGVLHRDVKPGNVLFDVGGAVALADLGMALLAGRRRLTATAMVVGTRNYLAPELWRGEAATPSTDVYALGVTLAEWASGARARAAAEDEGAGQALADQVRDRGLRKVLLAATHPDPGRRMGRARELARALRALMD